MSPQHSQGQLLRRAAVVAIAALLPNACRDATSSPPVGPLVAVTGLESGRATIIDATTARVIGRVGPALRAQAYPAVSADSSTLYYTGLSFGALGNRTVVAIQPRTGRVSWTVESLDTLFTGPGAGQNTTLGVPAFLVAPEQQYVDRIVWYVARQGGHAGLANVSPLEKTARSFVPMSASAIHVPVLRGAGTLPAGTVLLCGTRSAGQNPRANALFVLSPNLTVIDSVVVPITGFPAYDVAVTSNERFAYVKAYPELFKIDLQTRQLVGQASAPTFGSISLVADSLLLVTDPGEGASTPSSGKVFLYSDVLDNVATIDLTSLEPSGARPSTWDAVPDASGRKALVLAGTPQITLGQPPHRAGIFVVDLITRRAERYVALGEFGAGRIHRVR